MTTKELAESLGVSIETVRTTAKRVIDPSKSIWRVINGGKSQVFNEAQATAVKIELQNHSKVAKNGFNTLTVSNDLEGELLVQRAMEYQNRKIAELQRRAEVAESALDRIANGKGCFTMNQAAKALKLPYGNIKLYARLRNEGILNLDNSPKQEQVNAGNFKVIVKYVSECVGNKSVTLVTGKGLVYLAKRLGAEIDETVKADCA